MKTILAAIIFVASLSPAFSQTDSNSAKPIRPDLSKDKILYLVGYSHLDTQWRWDYQTTIDQYIKSTLNDNFALLEKYPEYKFNFTGAARYAMMKEYYPVKYEKLKKYIAQGRWFVSGSSVDEGDVLIPSGESIIRQILYGNDFFRTEFGKESDDYMLPDCFGFPACFPTVLSHCGIKGFSTQKLTWRSAVGVPFNVGVWEGPDGSSIMAALNPGEYIGHVNDRLDLDDYWVNRVEANGAKYGVFADYHYFGIGDMGGAPREQDVTNAIKSLNNSDSKIKVVLASSQQMFDDVNEIQKKNLPTYKGDLLLIKHSAGVLTSQAYMKRWNNKNELLADSAERAAVCADWLGGAQYPQEKLNRSWLRVLQNQFHDILPGTCIPKAYEYSWNDEIIALNGFATVLTDSAGAVSRALDTRAEGKAVIVYNPLAIEREDVVEAQIDLGRKVSAIQVIGPDGNEVPSQFLAADANSVKVLFLAKMPAVGFAVFDIRPSSKAVYKQKTDLAVTDNSIENEFYKLTINKSGDVASILDKKLGKELLSAPHRLEFMAEKPDRAPAWDMDYKDQIKPPYAYVDGPAQIRIVENGPVRIALEIKRKAQNSIFIQKISLSAGEAGKRIEFSNAIDWQSKGCALKAAFALTASNSKATYNWGVGTIERGNNDPNKYEVPSHEWFDLTDESGKYGVTILQHCKFGSDKPSDNTLRLTLLYTPGVHESFMDQATQDWGRHEIVYGIYGHESDWRQGGSEWQARRLNQPLVGFEVPSHDGRLGKQFSMLSVSTPAVDVRAIKKAEHSDYVIVRLQELCGQEEKSVTVSFAGKATEAFEVDGQERRIGNAKIESGKLVCDMGKNSIRSFAVKMEASNARVGLPISEPVPLKYNADVISTDDNNRDGIMENGKTYPAELFPAEMVCEGIRFKMGSVQDEVNNVMDCNGQIIKLPKGKYNRLYILAASAVEDSTGIFVIGNKEYKITVPVWTGFVGQYDNRIWDRQFTQMEFKSDANVVGIKPGFIKRDDIAWFASHRHLQGNESYQFCYIFKYGMDIPESADSIRLPVNTKIKIFAITAAKNENDSIRPVASLYDDFAGLEPIMLRPESVSKN